MNFSNNPRVVISSSLYAQRPADRENFDSLIGIVSRYEKGAETLEKVSKLGYKFMYEALMGDRGACNHLHKTIVLDGYHMQAMLAPVFVHEATHAMQFDALNKDVSKLQIADYIKLHRAAEADACAHQAAFTYEIKDDYPRVYEDQMQTPMMQAYVSEMEKSGDKNKAMKEAFEAWYSFETYQKSYETNHLREALNLCSFAKENPDNGHLQQKCTDKEIASLCQFNGKSYIDVAFLSSDQACAISKETKTTIQDELKNVARQLGANPDKSIATLPVRGKTSKTKEGKKQTVASSVALTKKRTSSR